MLKTVLLTSLVVVVPLGVVRSLGGFVALELAAYDDFVRRRPAEPPDDRITIVTISDADIEQLQQFPIHDATLAQTLETLERYKPRAIGLDIARDVPQGPAAGRDRLTKIIRTSDTIVSGCLLSSQNHAGSPPAPGTPEGGAAFVDFPTDADATIRRTLVVSVPTPSNRPTRIQHVCNDASAENELYSLSFELARLYLAANNINPEPTDQGEIRFDQTVLQRIHSHFGSYVNADASDYQMMLNYRGAQSIFREVSISDVLQNKLNPDWIRDRVILIGNTSNVSKDFLATPYLKTDVGLRNMNGVVVHAHAVSQILSAVLDQRSFIRGWPEVGEWCWIFLWSAGSGLLAFYNHRLGLFVVGVISLGAVLWGICYGLFVMQGLWIPWVPTLAGVVLTALGVRLVDLAQRTGYARAVYEQIRDQMQLGGTRDRNGDYLENLVKRARAIRQGEAASALMAADGELDSTATPEMKALYEQMAAKVRQEMDAEQLRQTTQLEQTRPISVKASRMQALLQRAERSRTQAITTSQFSDLSPSSENPHA